MSYLKLVLQIGLLCVISWLGGTISQRFNLGIPGNILGILFLFLVLQCRILPLDWIEKGANLLVAELVLFFIPSAVAVMKFESLMKQEGLDFFVIIGLSTLGVMIMVGMITEPLLRYRERK